jgi:amino acid adenylation domain-containing protein
MGVSRAYHIPLGLKLRGVLEVGALRRALDRVVERHEALRTTFVQVGGEAEQRIHGVEESRFDLVEHDLRGRGDAEEELVRMTEEEAGEEFDLEGGPLVRGRLVRLGEEEHALLITMHHIVSDGWSMGVLVEELSALYGAYVRGEGDPLPELGVQYVDYAVWQREWMGGEVLREQGEYWKKELEGAPALLELAADHERPEQQDFRGGVVGVMLDEELTAGLKALSQRQGTTLYMTLLGGWAALLGRMSGQEEVVIGTPTANRGRSEIEKLIGFFINNLALRVEVRGGVTVGELLQGVKEKALGAQQNQDIPFEQVVELLQPVRSLAHGPIFQVMLVWQNAPEGRLRLAGLDVQPLRARAGVVTKLDLTLQLRLKGERIVGGIEYAKSLFEAETMERYLGYLRALLRGMVAGDSQPIGQLPLLPAGEREQVLYGWNGTGAEVGGEQSGHEMFEAQAERVPEAVAVVYEGVQLSYGELNARANRLGHYLRGVGVKEETRVAICTERSVEMIIGLLGIWKAGGVYVPLDAGYPVERLRYMVEDSGAAVLLTEGKVREGLGERLGEMGRGMKEIDIGEGAEWWAGQGEGNVERGRGREEMKGREGAYVIYTSGTSGVPKGVMIEQRSVVNLEYGQREMYGIGEQDRVLQFFSFSFDVSVFVVVMALSVGARLVLGKREEMLPGPGLMEKMKEEGITVGVLPPVVLRHMPEGELPEMREVIVGGEGWSEELVERWGKGRRFFNSYGPTETTVQATAGEYRRGEGKPTIGRPVGNVRVYVLDGEGEPVPEGVAGELYIGGAGVGRGYLDGKMTAERYVPDPYSGEEGGRMYRTGDWGRWKKDGRIDLVGRKDEQVKIRGYRVELGEIEEVLEGHGGVKQAVVMMREKKGGGGEKGLVAY